MMIPEFTRISVLSNIENQYCNNDRIMICCVMLNVALSRPWSRLHLQLIFSIDFSQNAAYFLIFYSEINAQLSQEIDRIFIIYWENNMLNMMSVIIKYLQ
jgi:hypothetical protein